jgi:hypothetical protein
MKGYKICMDLMLREERVLEKKVKISKDNGEEYSVVISDRVFSGGSNVLGNLPYRVSIEIPKEKWDRITVGMRVNVTWDLPDV